MSEKPFVADRKEGGIAVLALEGNLTFASYRSLKEVLEGLQARNEGRVVLDLKKCAYMDSAGLGLIASFVASFRQTGGDIRLLHVAPALKETLTVTRLIKFFKVFGSLEDSLRSFAIDPPTTRL